MKGFGESLKFFQKPAEEVFKSSGFAERGEEKSIHKKAYSGDNLLKGKYTD